MNPKTWWRAGLLTVALQTAAMVFANSETLFAPSPPAPADAKDGERHSTGTTEAPGPEPQQLVTTPSTGSTTLPVARILMTPKPVWLVLSCGKGNVRISLENGSVLFSDCDPDEAGIVFWKAVGRMFPGSAR